MSAWRAAWGRPAGLRDQRDRGERRWVELMVACGVNADENTALMRAAGPAMLDAALRTLATTRTPIVMGD